MLSHGEIEKYLVKLTGSSYDAKEIAIRALLLGITIGYKKSIHAITNGLGVPENFHGLKALYNAYPNSATDPGNELDLISKFLENQAKSVDDILDGIG